MSDSLADKVSNLAATYASVTGTEARDVFLKAAAALRSMEQTHQCRICNSQVVVGEAKKLYPHLTLPRVHDE